MNWNMKNLKFEVHGPLRLDSSIMAKVASQDSHAMDIDS